MSDSLAILGRHPYFAGLPPKILAAIRGRVITKRYKKGAVIYAEGEASPGLYLVESGTVRIYKAPPMAESRISILGPASPSMTRRARRLPVATAEATSRGGSARSAGRVRDLILRRPEIGLSVSHVLAERVRELSALVEALAPASCRAAFVLRSADADPWWCCPRQDLAGQIRTVAKWPRVACDPWSSSVASGSNRVAAQSSSTAVCSTVSSNPRRPSRLGQ
jgi:hypothetical protein